MLWGCTSRSTTTVLQASTPPPVYYVHSADPAYDFAQATMEYGERQLLELDRKATEISLNLAQAASNSALATQEYNRLRQMELDYQTTKISLNITHAAATQEILAQQTAISRNSTVVAQSTAEAAARSAYLVNVTQTAHAQAILYAQVLQATQDAEALTAYPMTATPFAKTQAALLMQQYDREQQAFISRVIYPSIPFFAILGLLLLVIAGIALVYLRFLPLTWPPRLLITRENANNNPLIIIDGVSENSPPYLDRVIPPELTPANPPMPSETNSVHIEIVNATEPPVAHWITEVENQLTAEGWLP